MNQANGIWKNKKNRSFSRKCSYKILGGGFFSSFFHPLKLPPAEKPVGQKIFWEIIQEG